MPTASSKPARPIERSYSNPVPKKHRTVKRRGRAKDEFESDEEIVREVRTDSETDDDHSSIDSDSDSESSSSDLHADVHSEVVTPSTTQSPPPAELDRLPRDTVKDPSNSVGIFANATNWAEMVAGEAEGGAADLPVIDFADMDGHLPEPHPPSPPPRSRKNVKAGKKSSAARATSAPPPAGPSSHQDSAEGPPEEQEPVASTSHEPLSHSAFPSRSRGQTARQVYQQRLESDPSFVPKVGEFWGHDDRLLDKDLRSLSGWWRGRWQSRGRGRGAFSMRGRGRGGFFPSTDRSFSQDEGAAPEEPEVPPVERTWTHDGFEEMKKRDERRRGQQEQQQPNTVPQRGFGFRGRGFVPARGRGGAFARGGSISPTATQRPLNSNISMGERVWYAQKPERMWTKQHDIFLYSDIATKPRPGVGPGVKVKLPGGKTPLIIRLPPRALGARASDKPESTRSSPLESEKPIVVRIPVTSGKVKAIEEPPATAAEREEPATTVEELSIEEVFTVRPHAVPNRRIDLSVPSSSAPSHTSQPGPGVSSTPPPQVSQLAVEEVPHTIEELATLPADDSRSSPSVQIQESIPRSPPTSEEASSSLPTTLPPEEPQPRPALSMLHPLQTSFSPVPPPTSPPYGSPFGYAPPLPPGIGVNNQGMPYEYATGRPVYIQPTPPPMYTPRPMMHGHHPSLGVPFVPSHLRHQSTASPDFLAHQHTPHAHTPIQSFVDPATGMPIFSPARQSSRIEIRAPTEVGEGKKPLRTSHQRSSLSVAYSAEAAQPPYFSQQEASAEDGPPSEEPPPQLPMGHTHTPSMDSNVGYAPYPQPYYYHPEHYGYAPYVDMSQQMVHYEMYPSEQQHPQHHQQHHPSQPIVYY